MIPPAGFRLSHSDKMVMTGSCFVENISVKMLQSGFTVDVNPFGIVYNPASLAGGLTDLIRGTTYTENHLFAHEGIYHSFSHHSRFSGTTIEAVLEKINARMLASSAFLRQANVLIITFGTANVYRLIASGEVVSNCHKLPAKLFEEKRLTVHQITGQWNELIKELQTLHPDLKILFTVSPIRHWKDGANANQLSKATLLLAVNQLIEANTGCYYFPAYEIMLDDLRDYRFYADDLIHPNSQAIDYIWEKFGEAYFEKKTKEAMKEYEREQKKRNHRTLIA
jgi:hypothetical protein